MKKGAGKSKGNAYERMVCKRLSLWVTGGKRDDVLWRSAISGGRATVHAKKGRNLAHVAGDICAVSDEGHALVDVFFLECKCYRDLNAAALVFTGSGGKLHQFWLKACEEALRYNKVPMLIAKQNRSPTIVILATDTVAAFGIGGLELGYFTVGGMYIFSFEQFLKYAPVAALKKWRARRGFRDN